jgi:hypothetical protein
VAKVKMEDALQPAAALDQHALFLTNDRRLPDVRVSDRDARDGVAETQVAVLAIMTAHGWKLMPRRLAR